MPSKSATHVSPFESVFGLKPNYSKLKIIGCTCHPWLKPYTASKLHPNSTPCVFLGYSPSKSAYRCLDMSNNRLYFSRHVRFVENIFLFQVPPSQSSTSPSIVDPPGTTSTSLYFPSPYNTLLISQASSLNLSPHISAL